MSIVTKPIINGISTTSQSLVEVVGRMGGAGPMPTTAISRMVVRSRLITVPDKCILNQGDKISIEFGDLPGSVARLNGTSYNKSVPIHVACEGGGFDQGALNTNLGTQATTASGATGFNSSLLGTLSDGQECDDLGIMLRDESGGTAMPSQFYNVRGPYQDQSDRSLAAVLVAKPGVGGAKGGEFETSATVVAQFQQGDVMRFSALLATSMLLLGGMAQADTKLVGNDMYFHGTIKALTCSLVSEGDKIEVDFKQIATQDLYLSGCSELEKFNTQLRDCSPEVFCRISVTLSGREDVELTDHLVLDSGERGGVSGIGIGMSGEDGMAIRLDESTSVKEATEGSMTLNSLAWVAVEPSAIKNQSLEYGLFSTSGTWTLNYQ